MMNFLRSRLPDRNDIFLALGMASFLVFSWELRALFYNVPAFFLSYNLVEIASISAYMLAFALIETLIVILVVVGLAAILPRAWLHTGFSYKASFLFLALGIASIHLQFVMTNQPKIPYLAAILAQSLAAWLAAVLVTHYVPTVRRVVLDVLDRITIFTYIYLPLGVLSLFAVIFRLIW